MAFKIEKDKKPFLKTIGVDITIKDEKEFVKAVIQAMADKVDEDDQIDPEEAEDFTPSEIIETAEVLLEDYLENGATEEAEADLQEMEATPDDLEDEEEDEEDEEEEKPAKKPAGKPAKKPAKKEAPNKTAKSSATKKKAGAPKKREGSSLDHSNKDHQKLVKKFKDLFKDFGDKIKFKDLSNGINIRSGEGAKVSNRVIATFNSVRISDGTLKGQIAYNGIKMLKTDNIGDYIPEEWMEKTKQDNKGYVITHGATLEDVRDLLTDEYINDVLEDYKKLTKKLSDHRSKMEADVETKKKERKEKAKGKIASKKKAAPKKKDEEEE